MADMDEKREVKRQNSEIELAISSRIFGFTLTKLEVILEKQTKTTLLTFVMSHLIECV